MVKEVQRNLGQVVQMIYADRHGKITQRRVKLYASHGEYVQAFCLERRAVCSFIIDNILAIAPIIKCAMIQWQ